MTWTELKWGKYAGKTLPQILFKDPDWFFWAYEEERFRGYQRTEAEAIYRRATNIRVPKDVAEELVAEYMVHPSVNKFAGMSIVPKSRPKHEGSTTTYRSDVIDMSVPRQIAPYDKFGGAIMVDAIKEVVLGNPKARMTKGACEAFFNDSSNFVQI